jgi:hypothetical protein
MNKNEIQVFDNKDFGKVEVLVIGEKPYFPAVECAKILGYSNPYSGTDEIADIIFYNPFYQNLQDNPIFVQYNAIQQFDTVEYDWGRSFYMVSWRGLYRNPATVNELRENLGRPITPFDARVVNMQTAINSISLIVLAALLLGSIIAVFFMQFSIKLEMFYRRRELGYLQIFGVGKRKIIHAFLSEYILRAFFSLAAAFVLYVCIAVVVYFAFGILGMLPLLYITVMFVAILLFCGFAVGIPCMRFLKRSVRELIT